MRTLEWVDPEGNRQRTITTRSELGQTCRSIRRMGGTIIHSSDRGEQ